MDFIFGWLLRINKSLLYFLLESHVLESLAFGKTTNYQDIQNPEDKRTKGETSVTVISGTVPGSALSIFNVLV